MDIAQCIAQISTIWQGQPGASEPSLDDIERHTRLALPADFREFMRWSDGGAAKFPRVYLSLWSSSKVIDLNRDYQINRYLGDRVIAIGSDGGPICFLLDFRSSDNPVFASVNFGDLDPAEIKQVAPTFTGAVELAVSGQLDDDAL
ncbi:SMI1/KNR4 family protein [Burkholderia gladioli]|uniref:SMI1/KNR4 family protein n=2 Tax=Burkholderia gladioli TaxID=28095 RepID=UPI0024463818|nr:SMI1/KNR4 family protein [Burkholderia gladioli]